MKHFKVRVQYANGIDFLFECDAVTGWQAGALARVAGRLAGMGGSMDVKETIVQEVQAMSDYEIRKARDEQIAALIEEFETEFGEWDDGK